MRIRIVAIGMLLLLSAAVTAAMQNGNDLYQQGLARETAGDIKGAIQIFERIVQNFSSNHALAAKALLRLGQSSDLLGQDQSRKYYDRVIREFSDQTEAVAEARKRLAAFDSARPSSISARRINMPSDLGFSISADARLAAITDWDSGDLAIYDMSTGQTRRLMAKPGTWTPDSYDYAENPLLSPDSRQVVYAWFDGNVGHYHLRTMLNQPGAPQRVLAKSSEFYYFAPAAWSRDEKSVLVSMWKEDDSVQLAWISVADGTVRVLKSLGWRTLDHVSLSPDGNYVVYSATQSPDTVNSSIYVLAADGSSETELVQGPHINEAASWTPDGTRVFFTSNRSGGFGLWSIAVRNGRAAGSPELVKPDVGRISAMGFIPSGTYYYMHATPSFDIHVAELDPATSKLRKAEVPLTETFTGSTWPAWSPDGKSVAFARYRNRRNGVQEDNELVVRSLDTNQERTYVGAFINGMPMWLPDGKSVLVRARRLGRVSIYRVNLGTGEYTLALDAHARSPVLAPDGKTLYTWIDQSIRSFDLTTGQERTIFSAPHLPTAAPKLALSPDGKTLAFAYWTEPGSQPGPAGVNALIGVNGSGFRELHVGPEPIGELAWTRDGRAILFHAVPPMRVQKLMRLSIGGGEPEPTGLEIGGPFSLSPDGTGIAFSNRANGQQRIVETWALDNLLPKPAR